MDHAGFADVGVYARQWMHNDKPLASPTTQLSAEDMILQHAMQTANQEFAVDAAAVAQAHLAYQQQHSHHHHPHHQTQHQHQHPMVRHPLPTEQYNSSFVESDGQMLDRDDPDDVDSLAGNPGAPRPTGSRSSANNELEMRQLFSANRHRCLQDVAAELHGNERGPNSERTRQVFAMLWINTVCSKGKGSVPRGRVYANYASRCATERITVLNPASFGKLVRVLFPGLKTRRLGVRGESKYHYVNFALIEDQQDVRQPQPPVPRSLSDSKGFSQTFNATTTQPNGTVAHAPLPTPQDNCPIQPQPKPDDEPETTGRAHSMYNLPDLASIENMQSTATKTQLRLAFPSADEQNPSQSDPLALPPIEAYLPPGTDPDAAKSLSALYRSHCTSLVECIRYCREKTFFHLYTSFQGTLTMPVQKLFSNAALAPWIEGCDYALYQRVMSIIAGLTLQVVPKAVLDTLRNIAERLVPHIRESFQGQPQHVLAAKEAPAAIFAGLIDRALRVNLTAHAAANMLSNPANRDQMYVDWITMIRARKVAECVPTRGMDDLVDLLVTEVRDLLDPVNVPWEVECLTIYGDVALRGGRQGLDVDGGGNREGSQNVLDRWVSFLHGLPTKFPYASHTDIVWCVERVGTAVMRDLTLAQGKSFGSWWVTKTWLDEMVRFLAEQGGFMKQKPRLPRAGVGASTGENGAKEVGRQNSRCSGSSGGSSGSSSCSGGGNGEDVNLSGLSQTQPGRAPFPPPIVTTQGSQGGHLGMGSGDPHDDSGISMRTPDDDFSMEKFAFTTADGMGMVSGPELAV